MASIGKPLQDGLESKAFDALEADFQSVRAAGAPPLLSESNCTLCWLQQPMQEQHRQQLQ